MMELRINPLVVEDLRNIRDFISEDNPNAAKKTLQEIYSQFENVQRFPNIGADLSKRVSFNTEYRYVVWKNYIVIYKISIEYVEIYRILNRFQDITNIFEEY